MERAALFRGQSVQIGTFYVNLGPLGCLGSMLCYTKTFTIEEWDATAIYGVVSKSKIQYIAILLLTTSLCCAIIRLSLILCAFPGENPGQAIRL